MSVIDMLGDQEETLGTEEDLREEIVVEVMQQEISGSLVKIEFETSAGFCRGYYFSSELGREEINLEAESMEILKSLFPGVNGAFVHQVKREWVEISLTESAAGFPEYKMFSRIVTGGAV
ncbi:hypothetical protein [Dyadobacter pollutisoli]|uniref:Uncharacterized protein n=1 Tax=Dyadobacter pollutisoli TaxID=2910158 RepID=A0A9E8SR59_9BACT|nr:hypothetical protein [Dyadobacter pollutisoli]WAC13832.1 hypothetical protein ON006_07685 [Dyadobacter pollutisoli]